MPPLTRSARCIGSLGHWGSAHGRVAVRGEALQELERVLESNDGFGSGPGRAVRGSLAHCAVMCAVKANASALPGPF